jgi:hypothetical protein
MCTAKAEVGALFINGQDAIRWRNTLIKLGLFQTKNSTAAGFANNIFKQKRSKAMSITGSRTELSKGSFSFTGPKDPKTWAITSPSTMPTYHFMHPVFMHPVFMHPKLSQPKAQLLRYSVRVC